MNTPSTVLFTIFFFDVDGNIIRTRNYKGFVEEAKPLALQIMNEDARIKDYEVSFGIMYNQEFYEHSIQSK